MQVFRTLERSWSALFKRSPSLSLSSSLSPTLSGNNFHANLMLTAPFYLKPEPRSRCQIKCLTSQRRKTGLLFKAAATHENLLTALRSKLLLPGSWTATPSQMKRWELFTKKTQKHTKHEEWYINFVLHTKHSRTWTPLVLEQRHLGV